MAIGTTAGTQGRTVPPPRGLRALLLGLLAGTAWLGLLVREQAALISVQETLLREFRDSAGRSGGGGGGRGGEPRRGERRRRSSPAVALQVLAPRRGGDTTDGRGPRPEGPRPRRGRRQEIAVVGPDEGVRHLYHDPAGRPPMEALVARNGTFLGDLQPLLQIAIVGFGKCATSTLMHWLGAHPHVDCLLQEVWDLMHGRPGQLARHLYLGLPPRNDSHFQKCYKCPGDILERHILEYYRTYWPRTKLLVGIRHPLDWFVSLTMPHPNALIGRCMAGMFLSCTEKGNFAYYLLKLGKPNLALRESAPSIAVTDGAGPVLLPARQKALEDEIVGYYPAARFDPGALTPIPNEVFLFDMQQLTEATAATNDDEGTDRDNGSSPGARFRRDLQAFLGLSVPLPPLPHHRPGRNISDTRLQEARDATKIRDICRDEYRPVRVELMRLARLNSEWIRGVFVKLPTVTVSHPEHFDKLLERWMVDPCDQGVPTEQV